MRFVIATVLIALSAALVLIGVAIKGPFDDASRHQVDFELDSAYSYAVIPTSTLTKFPGEVSVRASGTDEIFYADARQRDIQDWIGTSNFVRLNLTNADKPDVTVITAGGENANPEGSDMWRTAVKVKNNLNTKVDMAEDTAILLASDGFKHAPKDISVIWQVNNLINWPLVLIIGGLVLLLIGLILNFWTLRKIRRLRGPRRRIPKAPTGPKYRKRIKSDVPVRGRRRVGRKVAIVPASLITLSLLSGCAGNQQEATQTESGLPKAATVVVNDAQLQRIVREVASTVKNADTNRDEPLLLSRVAGPALETRKIQYFLQTKNKKIPKLPDIVANPITVALPMQLPAEELGWQPRTIMVVTKTETTTRNPQMLVLQQATPRENYKLWYLIDLLPTDFFPAVAAQDIGAISVDADNEYLATKLRGIPFKYGDVINKGSTSKFFDMFDLSADQFYAARSQDQADNIEKLKKIKVAIRYQHSLGNPNILGMLTLESGGLVAVAMNDTSIIRPQVRGAAVSVTELDHKILLNAPGSPTGLKIVYENMMLFYVPVAGSEEKIRLVGASQGILSVKALD
ncbi:MAG: hypothetical protein EBZ61_01050 [Micrococcales bacterium]|nr:hypothetical protein [Micrococcales bacterium]